MVSREAVWWRLLTREHWIVFAGATLAWMFDCFDQQIFNLARDGAMESLLPSAQQAKEYGPYTTSVLLIAWAVGGLLFGALGDRHGRVRMLTVCILLYALGSGLSSLSTGMFDFCVYRFVSGLGIGGVFGLAVALLADSLPDRARAPALGLLQSISTWGNLAAAALGMLLGALAARDALPWGLAHWRVMFLAGALPALLVIVFARYVKEPQGWLAARADGDRRGIEFGSYRRLLGDPRWSKHAWLSPGELANEKAYWRSVGLLLQNLGGFCGMLALAMLAQARGRRSAFALSLALSFVTTVLVFAFMRDIHQMYWMLPLMGFGQLSVLGVYAVYLPELFPTSLRSTGTSFCYNVGRVVAATAPFTLSQLTKRLGGDIEGFRMAGIAVSFVLLLGIVVLPFLPETKGQPLPVD